MTIFYAKRFLKQYQKAPKYIHESFDERLKLFLENRSHPSLHYHPLHGPFEGKVSINVTGDWRTIFLEEKNGDLRFFAIGTHSELYK
ncbi:MAG TPA: hypothetical protein DCY48_03635 [Candidatus Magasanikbacteria bacterium]|nr:MAG: hypothetical protein A3I74_04640 [Candidatus Magasanikbacteria bacterium RIFCSPLOWO2_02_FULL_47_16]OGH79493.1 MAG: hypothetical protein A3C10_01610 [Candidatus Magasanikbacteria bacterium RIFCSPHIGHO2_02_FULL_48_18]OGH83161.1 MAG: hypothetical protein A3G08_04550 [Candidatus Magasanikbacteria bacterium RIFCSPLOWO2_12_FULL_47_9b]HAZ28836.1 hypothetical protein [Candidatus Magasanikbacteria bacterium]